MKRVDVSEQETGDRVEWKLGIWVSDTKQLGNKVKEEEKMKKKKWDGISALIFALSYRYLLKI